VVFHALGVAVSIYRGAPLNGQALLWGQIGITAIQLMTHYGNEYFDLEADRANHTPTRWSGGSRVLAEGRLPSSIALVAAVSLALAALMVSLALAFVVRTGPLTLPLMLLALLLAWEYSAPPLRLSASGRGELSTAILVPVLTPLVGYYLQSGELALLPLLAATPLACLQFAMLLAIEFPDAVGDRAAGKRTLVVRLGEAHSARLYGVSIAAAYLSLAPFVLTGLPVLVALAATLTLPLAAWQVWRMLRGDWTDPARWDSLAFLSVALLIMTALAETLAFLLLVGGVDALS
jgi:1,4-dihydroxy-2-naphthoate octaprenyltransferase